MERIIRMMKPLFPNFSIRKVFKFLDHPHDSESGFFHFDNTEDFLFLPEIHSAKKHLYAETISLAIVLGIFAAGFIAVLAAFFETTSLVIISGAIALFYFSILVFKLWVVYNAISVPLLDFTKEDISKLKDKDLPIYTIFIPLLREAEVVPQIVQAMSSIDYPTDKLDVIITLEEYDHDTINAIKAANPPSHFKMLILPDVRPKSKPKALNVAFKEMKGEYAVIYDAEIVPEPDQLKKAVLGFWTNPGIGILQTRLDHYNADQNLLTKLFNAEFAFYYDLFLPGLQKLGFPMPLSGHSVHFRKDALHDVGAWDPYNVTEDCDIGMRMRRVQFTSAVLNSVSMEEATSTVDGWIKQRTRWMKGFIQTTIVHLRHPLRFKNEIGGWNHFFAFLMTVPGTVLLNIINLFSWTMLILWFTTESAFIQSLHPAPILYLAVFTTIVSNFTFTYLSLLSLYKRERYHLVKYILLSPVYWVLLAYATCRAAVQMITQPHSWEKTKHGMHLSKKV